MQLLHSSELCDQLDVTLVVTLESSKVVKMALNWVATTQRQIMQFIQTSLAPSESASPKATMLHVHNMSLFLVACLLNRC